MDFSEGYMAFRQESNYLLNIEYNKVILCIYKIKKEVIINYR